MADGDLFQAAGLDAAAPRPLADRLRPKRLDDVVGQSHLLGQDGSLQRMVAMGRLSSLILWGPPGVGKTTIARLLASAVDLEYDSLSAVFSGVKDLRAAFDKAQARRSMGRGTLLFVDEIHRFNRAQQDGFLPVVEEGVITLVGATTENPSFELNAALLSRCQVVVLHRLDAQSLEQLLTRAETAEGRILPLSPNARSALIAMADGDGRYALNLAEQVFSAVAAGDDPLEPEDLAALVHKRAPVHDKSGDGHYDLISALHKAVRGSDPDAALYWLARMLQAGEDPLFIARRLERMATEDVGLADPEALLIAQAARESYRFLGSPEGELALAEATLALAVAPKSNALYAAWKAAQAMARENGSAPPPSHAVNAPTDLMKELGRGDGYVYDHATEEGFAGLDYFPSGVVRQVLYQPTSRGREAALATRLAAWAERRGMGKENT